MIMLLADGAHFTEIGRHFREGGGSPTSTGQILVTIGVLLVGVLVIAALARVLQRSERNTQNHRQGLFRELCRAHKLNRPERRMLRELARCQRLDQPGRLFLEPECWNLETWPTSSATPRKSLEQLRDHLFRTLTSSST